MIHDLPAYFVNGGNSRHQRFAVRADGFGSGQDGADVVAGMRPRFPIAAKVIVTEVRIPDHGAVDKRGVLRRACDPGADNRRRPCGSYLGSDDAYRLHGFRMEGADSTTYCVYRASLDGMDRLRCQIRIIQIRSIGDKRLPRLIHGDLPSRQ